MKAHLADYEQWKASNAPSELSLAEYIHGVFRTKAVAADAILAIAALVWPAFIEVDGLVLLAEQYSPAKLAELRAQGLSEGEAELWINLFCVDGFFLDLEMASPDHEEQLAETLVQSWEAKLAREFPGRAFHVRILRDADVGDLCVVFTRGAAP